MDPPRQLRTAGIVNRLNTGPMEVRPRPLAFLITTPARISIQIDVGTPAIKSDVWQVIFSIFSRAMHAKSSQFTTNYVSHQFPAACVPPIAYNAPTD
eukprot:scaffold952_cov409-Prasinococcus_capsulatus_cf.AAC.46